MRLPIDYTSDRALRVAFSWVTNSGAGVHFNRPIGWYQIHQCAALDEIEKRAGTSGTVRYTRDGLIQFRPDGKRGFTTIARAAEIFRIADTKGRV